MAEARATAWLGGVATVALSVVALNAFTGPGPRAQATRLEAVEAKRPLGVLLLLLLILLVIILILLALMGVF